MNNTLYIIRGIPGSGKSTLAKKLVGNDNYFEAHSVPSDFKIFSWNIENAGNATASACNSK